MLAVRTTPAKGSIPAVTPRRRAAVCPVREVAEQHRLVLEHQPLVERLVHKALKRVGFCCEADELRSAASVGLMEAAIRWDESRGIPFVAFAQHRIAGSILDELRAKDYLPRPSRQRARALEQARQKLVRKLKREPTEAELAKASSEDLDTFRRRGARERAQSFLSLEALPASRWEEMISHEEPSALDTLCSRERQDELARALLGLPERLRTVLSLYYQEELSYREIGEMLGVCESRICQLIKGAQRTLREAMGA